jgi:hypothetical protein
MTLTLEHYAGPYLAHPDLTPARRANAMHLIECVNAVIAMAEADGIACETNPHTGCLISGEGNGPIDAFVRALRAGVGATLDVTDYAEHAIGAGSEATAVAYVETTSPGRGVLWGVGTDPNTSTASLRAVLNAHERSLR